MDELNIESPFFFELGDELIPLPCLSPPRDMPVPQLASTPSLAASASQKPKNGRQRKPPLNTCNHIIGDESLNEQKKKKIVHRDVERQRRQEMSSLYSTLRSLLPIEYLKGKRSICDHIHETVKYIENMQNKIQQLSDRRDELKILSSDENLVASAVETVNSSERESVVVRAKNGSRGVQVVVYTPTQHMLLVSNILQALAAEGLEVLSYISTKVNDRFLHTIECQVVVNAGRYQSIDVAELQHKLTTLVYLPLE